MDSPSPVAPTFTFPTLPAPTSAAGPTTRSGGAAPGAAPAASGGQPPSIRCTRPCCAIAERRRAQSLRNLAVDACER
eukprot:2576666-Pleurochrysis_carterae.AAC.1